MEKSRTAFVIPSILIIAACALATAGCAKGASAYDPSRLSLALSEEPKTVVAAGSDFASIAFKPDELTGRTAVLIELGQAASERLAEATAANIGKKMGLSCDGREFTSAVIMGEIPGGKIMLTLSGEDSVKELKALLKK